MSRMQPGDKVQIVTTGTVKQISRHHGVCFEVELDQKDYRDPNKRTVWLDSSEVKPLIAHTPDALVDRGVL